MKRAQILFTFLLVASPTFAWTPAQATKSQAAAEAPRAYSLEQRHFFGQPDDPNPIVRIYVSGAWRRSEVHMDGKLQHIEITRPDRNVVYLVDGSDRTYIERPFEELRAKGWSSSGGFSLADYQENARKGRSTLTRLGAETINGQACEKYEIAYGKLSQLHFWVSVRTGLPVLHRFVLPRDLKARIEWSNLKVGPQPAALFEPPRGYGKVQPNR